MQGERRSFLARVIGGTLGLAGFLWSGQARAWHRTRRCCPPPVVCGPEAAEYLCPRPPEPAAVLDDIVILYPDANTSTVPGGGGFYVWGTINMDPRLMVSVTGATCGGVTGQRVNTPQHTTVNNWAYLFNNVPTGSVTLKVTGTKTDPLLMKQVAANPASKTFNV
jgi:hypothetical protein